MTIIRADNSVFKIMDGWMDGCVSFSKITGLIMQQWEKKLENNFPDDNF